jgi:hypothetical protein
VNSDSALVEKHETTCWYNEEFLKRHYLQCFYRRVGGVPPGAEQKLDQELGRLSLRQLAERTDAEVDRSGRVPERMAVLHGKLSAALRGLVAQGSEEQADFTLGSEDSAFAAQHAHRITKRLRPAALASVSQAQ